MPYKVEGNCVKKADTGETVPGGCHKNHEEALAHQRALEANVKDSAVVELSMRITKASYNKSEKMPMNWTAIDSDVDADLYQERMSPELYMDFCSRIQNKTPIPEQFHDVICEQDWCGGMPYLSIAHYKAGTGMVNVPGTVESVFVDGVRLKSKGKIHDNEMGRKVWESLREDLYMEKSGNAEHQPVRISIGFLDLEHEHVAQNAGGQSYTFTRTDVGQICPLCSQGIGGKIYKKGQLVHLAMTRVPVNPRTRMMVENSMDEIKTKRQDAESIIGDLAEELEEKSIANDVLVVRAEDGSAPTDDPSPLSKCYDPNNGTYDQKCIDGVMSSWMASVRNEIGTAVKSLVRDEVDALVVEEAKRKDVSSADKKRAEKEYGDVKYADEANKKYPIDTEEHIRAAWNYIHQERNANKYPDGGAAIKRKILAAWKDKIGGEPPSAKEKSMVEESMDTVVEKMVAGGESVPEKPFNFAGLDGSGNNTIANPVKAKNDGDNDADDNGGKETPEDKKMDKHMKEMSALDKSFEALKSTLANAKSVEDVQKAFNELGTEVEKSYTPPAPDMSNIAEIVRSAVEAAVTPLKVEIAQLKAQGVAAPVQTAVKSKALTYAGFNKPEDLLTKAIPGSQQPTRKLSQIEQIARKSTGLQE